MIDQPFPFVVGDIECTLLSDGGMRYVPETLVVNAAAATVRTVLHSRLDERGKFLAKYRPLLIRTGTRHVLIDSGLGDLAKAVGEPAGHLRKALKSAGLTPDDIDVVVLTHCHPDHIGGLTAMHAGKRIPVFRRAKHFVWQTEWDFWTSEDSLANLPDILSAPARLQLPALREAQVVVPLSTETEVASGVLALPLPGHTPGHMVVAIARGNERAVYAGDALIDVLNFRHPDWYSPVDAIPDLTVKNRRNLLDAAVRDGSLFLGFHIPPGRVSRRGAAYHLEPVQDL